MIFNIKEIGTLLLFDTADEDNLMLVVYEKGAYKHFPITAKGKYTIHFAPGLDPKSQEVFACLAQETLEVFLKRKILMQYVETDYSTLPKTAFTLTKVREATGFKTKLSVKEVLKNLPDCDGSSFVFSEFKGKERDYSHILATNKEMSDIYETMKAQPYAKYNLTPEWQRIAEGLKHSKINNLWIVGPPGTGKTTLAQMLCLKLGAPALMKASYTQDPDEYTGCVGVNPDYDGISPEPPNKFNLGPILKGYDWGIPSVLDDITNNNPQTISVLHPILDGTPCVTYNNTVFRRHDNFIAILTSNPGVVGTQSISPAIIDRSYFYEMPAETQHSFILKIHGHYKALGIDLPLKFLEQLYAFKLFIDEASRAFHENRIISLRGPIHFLNFVTSPSTEEEFKFHLNNSMIIGQLNVSRNNSFRLAEFLKSSEFMANFTALYDAYPFKQGSGSSLPDVEYAYYYDKSKEGTVAGVSSSDVDALDPFRSKVADYKQQLTKDVGGA